MKDYLDIIQLLLTKISDEQAESLDPRVLSDCIIRLLFLLRKNDDSKSNKIHYVQKEDDDRRQKLRDLKFYIKENITKIKTKKKNKWKCDVCGQKSDVKSNIVLHIYYSERMMTPKIIKSCKSKRKMIDAKNC